MDILLDGNRVRTTSAYDPRVMYMVGRLEGMKRWSASKSLSFERTPYNLSLWKETFPHAKVEQAIAEPEEPAHRPSISEAPRPPFRYKTQPRAHQSRAMEKLYGLTASGLFMDIGTGKSWVGISVMGRRWCEGLIDGVLIVAKNKVHCQWVKTAIPRHMSEAVPWKAYIWEGHATRADLASWEALRTFAGLQIFAINVEAIGTKVAQARIEEFLKRHRGRSYMIVDESQLISNQNAARTELAIGYGAQASYRMIMTGTPISKNVADYFSQFKFLDERILSFRYLTSFKARYCIERLTPYGTQVIDHQNLEELVAKMEPFIYRITSEEALDLPPKWYDDRPFSLTKEQRTLIRDLRSTMLAYIDSKAASTKNAAGMLTRIQQISCGYLPMDDGSIHYLAKNPRMEELLSILDQCTGKVIIWARFNEDIRLICKALGNSAMHYYGRSTDSEKDAALRCFTDPDGIPYLVASPEAAGTGLDGLQEACRINIYYSNSFNALARWQSEGRTWRDGTTGTVTYFDLIGHGSPDRKILNNLRDKKSISDLTLDDFRKILENDD